MLHPSFTADLKPDTLDQLKALHFPAVEDLQDFEGKLCYPAGLQRILQGASKPARLSRQPVSWMARCHPPDAVIRMFASAPCQ